MLNQILLIDDDPINNFLNEKIIQMAGVAQETKTFTTVEDAIHHLDWWCVLERKKCPELILLDISMPSLDGFDFIQIFQKLKFKKDDTHIAILSSSQDERDIRKVQSMGIDHYLVKPLKEKALCELIDKIAHKGDAAMSA